MQQGNWQCDDGEHMECEVLRDSGQSVQCEVLTDSGQSVQCEVFTSSGQTAELFSLIASFRNINTCKSSCFH